MNKLKTEKTTLVRYMGYRDTVSRNSLIGQPYHFMRERWLEIDMVDADFYVKKATVDDAWEVKLGDRAVMETHYYAQWISNSTKQKLSMSLSDKDVNGNVISGTLREYVFNNRIWVKLDIKDIGLFKTKAEGNKNWKFEKAYLQEGVNAPLSTGVLVVQEQFNKMKENKIIDPKKSLKEKIKTKITKAVKKEPIIEPPLEFIEIDETPLTDKNVVSPSSDIEIIEKPTEAKKTSKKVVKKLSKPKSKLKENDE